MIALTIRPAGGDLSRRSTRGRIQTAGLLAIAFLLGISFVAWLAAGPQHATPETPLTTGVSTPAKPTRTPRPSRTPRPTRTPEVVPTSIPTPVALKVGIVAGHWKNDSGAVCPDGLEEVSINLDVASRLVAILQYEGYNAELLPEFSDSLKGYRADAFVSVHTDSCNVPEASGFKVARVAASAIPDQEDRLVGCLAREYAKATQLSFHTNSITYDMTEYHAFGEIDPATPAAIIELGFMGADRDLLTNNSYAVAQGIARGIACFLEGD